MRFIGIGRHRMYVCSDVESSVTCTNRFSSSASFTHYAYTKGCSYFHSDPNHGRLRVNQTFYPTTLVNTSVEAFGHKLLGKGVLNIKDLGYVPEGVELYDTVIVMNVMVYSRNAFEFLETLYRTLKPGGLLFFHDRFFDNLESSSNCKMAGFLTHMIQVRGEFIEYFLSEEFFEHLPYYNTTQNEDQRRRGREWCPGNDLEMGVFAALRKKGGDAQKSAAAV
jgi:SAM-dependent methyltransferase